ncbi:TetR/AcrR family transcriptional regulator [Mycolicibacterium nivoides]|uniref:TetR/AcrR family transcriptional regulator n=1 Tax=Mycolicibacterium nivoides TaxID=2487344 RepID=UPI000F5BAA7B|nr:TetR/AcrR family transcriptional regulator [Mycolicibacterium nivoides]QRY45174.1 TetR/AcrR family transcriptional regulator [Mycolicibacterium boenickei]
MARNRQQIPKADRQAEVLSHARQLFVAKGYRATSVTQVGKAAGIASAAVHWYFPTKDDLFAAVLGQIFDEARADVEDLDVTPEEKLVRLLEATKAYRIIHREAYERMAESQGLRAVYSETAEWLECQLLLSVEQRLPAGYDTAAIADVAHVLFEGLLVSQRDLDRPIGEIVRLLIDALVASATAESAVSPER